ncbi:MAG: hypothetical protein IJT83_05215, partial [Victivallales bacterium]|nr:hypothetical protein [Victivallales bacterium]
AMMASGFALAYPILLCLVHLFFEDYVLIASLCIPFVFLLFSLYARPAPLAARITVFLIYGILMAAIGIAIYKLRMPLDHDASIVPYLRQGAEQVSSFLDSLYSKL